MKLAFVPGVAAFLTAILLSAPARAYDLSGHWLVLPDENPSDTSYGGLALSQGWHLHLAQAAGTVASAGPDNYRSLSGTIEESTGEFRLEAAAGTVVCTPLVVTGSVASDGRTFTGTYSYSCAGPPVVTTYDYAGPVAGTRCGNGQLDGDEACDDGNAASGDCCSSACTLDAEGTACTADGDACTSDTCDGAGACVHASHTGPCTELHGCGTGSCATGACVVDAASAAGTDCDLDDNACTLDVCDGTGQCTAGPALDCSPCGACFADAGCVAVDERSGEACSSSAEEATISLRTSADARKKRLKLKVQQPSRFQPFPDPTATADYAACLLDDDGGALHPVLASAVIPAGELWSPSRDGSSYRYRDRTRAHDGVVNARVSEADGLQMKGLGANLPLPPGLAAWPDAFLLKIAAAEPGFTTCWQLPLQIDERSETELRGSFVGATEP